MFEDLVTDYVYLPVIYKLLLIYLLQRIYSSKTPPFKL